MGKEIVSENKTIVLHHNRHGISERLKTENCSMLAYIILTGKSLRGRDISQKEYDECVDAAESDD